MNAILHTLSDLHRGEHDLAQELLATSDRHRTDHEVFHVARDIRQWSIEHAQRIADLTVSRYDTTLRSEHHPAQHLIGRIRDKAAETLGRQPQPGLLLLHDLSGIYLMASHNSLYWGNARPGRASHPRYRTPRAGHPMPPADLETSAVGQHADQNLQSANTDQRLGLGRFHNESRPAPHARRSSPSST